MNIAKYFFGIVLLQMSMSNCSSRDSNKSTNDEALKEFCQTFVKAICTKDTVTFFKLVDKPGLTESMNEWFNDDKKLSQEDLFFPFFFVYSPMKIRQQDLMNKREKKDFFSEFKIEDKEMIDELNIKLNLKWTENLPESLPQRIELRLKKINEWKIIGARWKTL